MNTQQPFCPQCLTVYDPNTADALCTNTGCAHAGRPIPPKGEEGAAVCPFCGGKSIVVLCPQCGFEILEGRDHSRQIPITILGSAGAGKSNYLAVLIRQLKTELKKSMGCTLFPLGGDRTIQQYERYYHNPLYLEGTPAPPSRSDELSPLLYSLVFGEEKPGEKPCDLLFYDSYGPFAESERDLLQNSRGLLFSKGILLMIDPMQLTFLQEQLSAGGKPAGQPDPTHLLTRLVRLIRQGAGQQDLQQKIRIPLAVCLTKSDLLRPYLDPGSFLLDDSRQLLAPGFNRPDFESCSVEVRSLLESWLSSEFISQLRSQFEQIGFFGVSALGAAPGVNNRVSRLSPQRVLDPLLWVLWKNGVYH